LTVLSSIETRFPIRLTIAFARNRIWLPNQAAVASTPVCPAVYFDGPPCQLPQSEYIMTTE